MSTFSLVSGNKFVSWEITFQTTESMFFFFGVCVLNFKAKGLCLHNIGNCVVFNRKHSEPSSNLFLEGGMFTLSLPILILNYCLTTPHLAV